MEPLRHEDDRCSQNPSRPLEGLLVLLAEDRSEPHDGLAAALRVAGAEILSAADGAELREAYRNALSRSRTVNVIVLGHAVPPVEVLPTIALLRAAGFAGLAIGLADRWALCSETAWMWSECDFILTAGRRPESLAVDLAHLTRLRPAL